MLRIKRQYALDALDEIQDQHRDGAEHQHGGCIFGPAHLVRFIHAGDAIEQALQWPQRGIEEGTLSREDTRHKNAERLGDGEDQSQEYENLQPAIDRHFRSLNSELLKFLRAQKSVEQIRDYRGADDEHDEGLCIHEILLLHAIAKTYVRDGYGKEDYGDGGPKNVLHE